MAAATEVPGSRAKRLTHLWREFCVRRIEPALRKLPGSNVRLLPYRHDIGFRIIATIMLWIISPFNTGTQKSRGSRTQLRLLGPFVIALAVVLVWDLPIVSVAFVTGNLARESDS